MKWDLFLQIANKKGCLCSWPNVLEWNILGGSFFSTNASTAHSLVDLPNRQYSIRQPWLQHRANSFSHSKPKKGG